MSMFLFLIMFSKHVFKNYYLHCRHDMQQITLIFIIQRMKSSRKWSANETVMIWVFMYHIVA